jgi:hypothetical protein
MGIRLRDVCYMLVGVCLFGCAGAGFPYRYYGLDAQSYDGFLRGDKPDNDLKLDECAPTSADKAPCMVMKTDALLRLKQSYQDMELKLRKCEQPRTGD